MKQEIGACIVELRGRYAAALTEDGRFVRVRNRNYMVGQTVRVSFSRPQTDRRTRTGALAAMAAGFLLLLLGGFKGYQTPVGVVSLDVNPSIEYTINCFDRVLSIDAVNASGAVILEQMDRASLVYLSIGDAVEQTIETLRKNGYLELESENDVLLSASSYSERHAGRLTELLNSRVAQQQDLTVTSVSVTSGEVQKAHALGTSAGKLFIIEQLEQSAGAGEHFEVSDWLEKPVREIMQRTQEQRGATPQGAGEEAGAQQPSGAQTAQPSPIPSQEESASDNGQSGQGGGEQPGGGGQTGDPAQGNPGEHPPQGSSSPPHG